MMAAVAGAAGVWTAAEAAPPATPASQLGKVSQASQVRQASQQPARLARTAGAASHVQLDAFLSAAPARRHRKAPATPRRIALSLLHRFGWSERQFPFLNRLWAHESSWNVHAENAYSGAYGIPQAVPGVKMSAAGPDWRTSARTQILWGLRYIKGRYGSPSGAWNHEVATGWY